MLPYNSLFGKLDITSFTDTVSNIIAQKFFIDGSSLQTFRTGRNRRFPAKYDGKPVLIIDI